MESPAGPSTMDLPDSTVDDDLCRKRYISSSEDDEEEGEEAKRSREEERVVHESVNSLLDMLSTPAYVEQGAAENPPISALWKLCCVAPGQLHETPEMAAIQRPGHEVVSSILGLERDIQPTDEIQKPDIYNTSIPLEMRHVYTAAIIHPSPYDDSNMALHDVLADSEIITAEEPDPQLIGEGGVFSDFVDDASAAAAAAAVQKADTNDSINTDIHSDNPVTSIPSTSKNQGKGMKRGRPETQKATKPRKKQKDDAGVKDAQGQTPQKRKFTTLNECYDELNRLTAEVVHNHKRIMACKERNAQIMDRDLQKIYSAIKALEKYRMLTKSAYYQRGGGMNSRGKRKQKKPCPGDLYWKRRRKLIKKARQTLARSKSKKKHKRACPLMRSDAASPSSTDTHSPEHHHLGAASNVGDQIQQEAHNAVEVNGETVECFKPDYVEEDSGSEDSDDEIVGGVAPWKFAAENWNYVGPLPLPKYYGVEYMMPAEKTAFTKWYEENRSKTFDMQKELAYYCQKDVEILVKACTKISGKLMFVLCSSCAETQHQEPCDHTDEERALSDKKDGQPREIVIHQPGIVRNKRQWTLHTKTLKKTQKVVFDKRVIKEGFTTLPYGY
ncbi:uncharacterized protein [Anolis sagrei]|uniref:uncharacterized protein n=1 Tax=Anolis sagrei TaxID=38937 RepID=UPI00351FD482